jgi:hypothetical protein
VRSLLTAAFLVLLFPVIASANTAPVLSIGPALQPLAETKVRLESERIEVTVRPSSDPNSYFLEREADYRIRFRFMPEADEELMAGFPLIVVSPTGMWMGQLVRDFAVSLNGQAVAHEKRDVLFGGAPVPWAVYRLSFRQEEPLELEVTYQTWVSPRGKTWQSDLFLSYILQTGRYWAGTIGRAEAVVTFDRSLQPEDVTAETTAGWQRNGNTLSWEWRDFEPEFDLTVVVNSFYWLDLPVAIEEALAIKPSSRSELIWLLQAGGALFEGDGLAGNWMPVRSGLLSGEAAEPLVGPIVAAVREYLAANPPDWQMRQRLLEFLWKSAWEHTWDGARLVSSERLQLYFAEEERYRLDGGPPVSRSISETEWLAWIAVGVYSGTQDEALRRPALEMLLAAMPPSVRTEEEADAWTEATLRFPRLTVAPVLPQGLREDLTEATRARVWSAPPAPGMPETPAATGPGEPAAAKPTDPVEIGLPSARRLPWGLTGAFLVVLLAGGGYTWHRISRPARDRS